MCVWTRQALAQSSSGKQMQMCCGGETAHQVQQCTATADFAVRHMLLHVHGGLRQCICYDEK